MLNLIRPFRIGQKHCKTRRSLLRRDHQLPAIETLEARVLLDAGGLDLGAPAVDEPADHGDGISYEVAGMHWIDRTGGKHTRHVDHVTWDTDPTADALVTVTVLVHDHGNLTTDKVARIDDAVAEINSASTIDGSVLLNLQTTRDENASHQIHLHESSTSVCGDSSSVLGCAYFYANGHTEPGEFKDGHGNFIFSDVYKPIATVLSGFDWYTGSDAALIGVGQYDYQTVATHELLHLVGLHHDNTDYSADPEVADNSDQLSVMKSGLGKGNVRRLMSTHDQELLGHFYGPGQDAPSPDDGGGGGGGGGGGNKGGGKGGGKPGAGMSGIIAGTSQPADFLAPFVFRGTSSLFDDTKTDETSDTVESAAAITSPRGVSAVSADQTTDGLSDGRLTDEDSADEEATIDAESVDNLFADFNEGLLDDLLAV